MPDVWHVEPVSAVPFSVTKTGAGEPQERYQTMPCSETAHIGKMNAGPTADPTTTTLRHDVTIMDAGIGFVMITRSCFAAARKLFGVRVRNMPDVWRVKRGV